MALGFDSTQSTSFTGFAELYQQYSVTGVRIEWIPGQMRSVEAPGSNTNIDGIVMTDFNVYPSAGPVLDNLNLLEQNQSYQIRGYENSFSRYINFRALSRS